MAFDNSGMEYKLYTGEFDYIWNEASHSFFWTQMKHICQKNINMEAIKELTNRSDVTSVHIGALLVPLPDDLVDEPAVDGW